MIYVYIYTYYIFILTEKNTSLSTDRLRKPPKHMNHFCNFKKVKQKNNVENT